jgi:hypothetical protein
MNRLWLSNRSQQHVFVSNVFGEPFRGLVQLQNASFCCAGAPTTQSLRLPAAAVLVLELQALMA